jgi:putative iron-regulated protein
MNKTKLLMPVLGVSLIAGAIASGTSQTVDAASSATPAAVLENYRSLAELEFSDALAQAKALNTAIDAFLADPTEKTLASAKTAWFASRVPYQQTEVYRFGNAYVDDWEGKVNAWPLDEGLIDYVDASYGTESDENPYYSANIIANPKLTIGGKEVDATTIDKKLLAETLHEIDEVESNVATGYHVIEFLLWGQDLYGTNPGAGERPASDFSTTKCTGGNCDRRRDYLKAATDLLIDDLNDIVAAWAPEGDATKQLQAKGDQGGLSTILTGMGSLAYGELAGERIKLGLMLHDPEEEHDCFSDNTHYSHFYDAVGIKNVYMGSFTDSQGKTSSGASLSALIATMNADLDQEMKQKLDATEAAMQVMVDSAKAGSPVDVLIGEGNTKGNQIIQNVVDALVSQTKTTEKIVAALKLEGIEVEGSDSLDNPEAVFN